MKNLDPRVKLFWLVIAAIGIFRLKVWYAQLSVAIVLGTIIIFRAIFARENFKVLRILLVFLPLTFLIHILFGTHLLATIFRSAPRDPWSVLLLMPLTFTLRIGNLIALMALATHWLKALEVLDAIYHLLKPLRIIGLPVDDIFQVIFIAVRFIPLMQEEYQRLDDSWRIFMNCDSGGLFGQIERLRTILVPLMVVSFRRAEVLAEAMTVRGYDSKIKRSYVGQLRWQFPDWIGLAAGCGGLILMVVKI
ncbi:MAG TPA: energy-coupling factor transporter transmembrane component T [Candidatus Marinimicrobia bacterium]|nr:energy-coupling factor transporter transmembrane component T [Candidatus Neomarinimicrobiota bacterium]HRS51864.1 energy-coupling factor transporter transmembrane component T [Candidatus Neomarinimicrobiota bacterium]HRU92675.1 energy-coupling factor transporter transmembrane component T [Candidatus Neomarinimicrobiota bacterium]